MTSSADATFFATPAKFRAWLHANHEKTDELWVGYYKKGTGIPSITWPESVDEALCYGWIDGLRKSIDDQAYCIRFTPRRPTSNWSQVNLARVKELTKLGRMMPAGLRAHRNRKPPKRPYSYEREAMTLTKEFEASIKKNAKAWKHFNSLAPSYRKLSVYWVMSAKKAETQRRRLGVLIASSAKGERIPPLLIGKKKRR